MSPIPVRQNDKALAYIRNVVKRNRGDLYHHDRSFEKYQMKKNMKMWLKHFHGTFNSVNKINKMLGESLSTVNSIVMHMN